MWVPAAIPCFPSVNWLLTGTLWRLGPSGDSCRAPGG